MQINGCKYIYCACIIMPVHWRRNLSTRDGSSGWAVPFLVKCPCNSQFFVGNINFICCVDDSAVICCHSVRSCYLDERGIWIQIIQVLLFYAQYSPSSTCLEPDSMSDQMDDSDKAATSQQMTTRSGRIIGLGQVSGGRGFQRPFLMQLL